jgi:hypothetical protein
MQMRKILISFAAGLLAAGASAQSLRFISAGTGIYCHFSDSCQVTPTVQSDTVTATNSEVACTLVSRSFAGTSQNAQGQYGYEYQVSLSNNGSTGTNTVTVNSLTLKFGEPQPFAFGEHASNYVWVLTSGGPVGPAPDLASAADNKVTFTFTSPLALDPAADQSTNTCYFGLVSAGAPEITTAILSGSVAGGTNGVTAFTAELQAQTP